LGIRFPTPHTRIPTPVERHLDMAQIVQLKVESRSTQGTGAARAMRRDGQVPAVIYGRGRTPSRSP